MAADKKPVKKISDEEALQYLKDIDEGKILPTLEQLVMISIFYGRGEQVNLKELYPKLYAKCEKTINEKIRKRKAEDGVPSSFWAW